MDPHLLSNCFDSELVGQVVFIDSEQDNFKDWSPTIIKSLPMA